MAPEREAAFPGFAPEAIDFLRRLRRDNRREWFEPRREEYERLIARPMRLLVEEMDVRFATLAPEFVGDPKRSVFRIHRDLRFSADKSPYKTTAACWFFHRAVGRGVGQRSPGASGFYFHLDPDEALVAGGYWMPARPALDRIRETIAGRHAELRRIVAAPAFRRRFGGLTEEAMLTRMPRGFPADHPAADLLRFQSFTASRTLAGPESLDRRLPATLARDYAALLPLVRWLNAALGLPTADRR